MQTNATYTIIAIIILAIISIAFFIIKAIRPQTLKDVSYGKMNFFIMVSVIVLIAINFFSKNGSVFSVTSESPIQMMAYNKIFELEKNQIDLNDMRIKIDSYEKDCRAQIDSISKTAKSSFEITGIYSKIDSLFKISQNPNLLATIKRIYSLYYRDITSKIDDFPNNPNFSKSNSQDIAQLTYQDRRERSEYITMDVFENNISGLAYDILYYYNSNQEILDEKSEFEFLENIKNDISSENFDLLVGKIRRSLTTNLENSILNLNAKYNEAKKNVDELALLKADAKKINQSQTDDLLIKVIVPIFALLLLAILFIPWIYRDKAVIISALFEDKLLLQSFTVFILVITIILLALGNKLTEQALGTLLGGISVYVLQQTLGAANKKDVEMSIDKLLEVYKTTPTDKK